MQGCMHDGKRGIATRVQEKCISETGGRTSVTDQALKCLMANTLKLRVLHPMHDYHKAGVRTRQ